MLFLIMKVVKHLFEFFSSGKSMIGYFMSELMKGYNLEDDAREFVERRDRVYTSVYTPKNLEKVNVLKKFLQLPIGLSCSRIVNQNRKKNQICSGSIL